MNKDDVKMKSFKNEIFYGIIVSLRYPENLREFSWTVLLYLARLYLWIKAFYEIRMKKDTYNPDWSRSESTKTLDYENKK